jgi:hypothetical protein
MHINSKRRKIQVFLRYLFEGFPTDTESTSNLACFWPAATRTLDSAV